MIPDMEALLTRLKDQLGGIASGRIMQVGRCNEALTRACKQIGISRLTHHDLRHLFATRCIESGVETAPQRPALITASAARHQVGFDCVNRTGLREGIPSGKLGLTQLVIPPKYW